MDTDPDKTLRNSFTLAVALLITAAACSKSKDVDRSDPRSVLDGYISAVIKMDAETVAVLSMPIIDPSKKSHLKRFKKRKSKVSQRLPRSPGVLAVFHEWDGTTDYFRIKGDKAYVKIGEIQGHTGIAILHRKGHGWYFKRLKGYKPEHWARVSQTR